MNKARALQRLATARRREVYVYEENFTSSSHPLNFCQPPGVSRISPARVSKLGTNEFAVNHRYDGGFGRLHPSLVCFIESFAAKTDQTKEIHERDEVVIVIFELLLRRDGESHQWIHLQGMRDYATVGSQFCKVVISLSAIYFV